MKENDAVLIHRILEGDDSAFSVLVEKYQKQVHALAWRKIGDFHIAEEITQDTFLKAYQKLMTLKNPQRFAGWLYVIATRCCQAWLRKKQIQTESLDEIDSEDIQPEAYSRYVADEDAKATVAAQRQVVKKLLATLPESERTVITLHYFGEMTCEQMSEFLGVSANTIKSRLRRARNRLKQEEPMIREATSNFQISSTFTNNIMQEVSRLKPNAPSASKPIVPWVMGAASAILMVLMLGLGSQHLMRFQRPYSLNAKSETTVELVDALIVQNAVAKQDDQNQPGASSDTSGGDDGNENEANQILGDQEDYTLWKLPEGAKTRLSKGSINGISFSPDGTQIAVSSATGVWIYDANTGTVLSLLTDHTTHTGKVAYSPDGKTLASGMYGDISLWDTSTGKHLKSFAREESLIHTLKIFNDGKTLLSGHYPNPTSFSLWDITTGAKRDFHSKTSGGFSGLLTSLFGRGVSTADLYLNNVDGNSIFAVGYEDGRIRLEDITTGRHLNTFQGHKGSVNQLMFSPDGALLASVGFNGPIHLWDVTVGKLLTTLTQNPIYYHGILAFSQDGKTLACRTGEGEIELWDVVSKTLRTTLRDIYPLAFSPDSKRVAGVNQDGKIHIWDVNSGEMLFLFSTEHTSGLRELAFSSDNSILGAGQGTTIQLWDTATFARFPNHIDTDGYIDFVFSLDGNTVTSATGFKYTKEWRGAHGGVHVKESVNSTLNVWDVRSADKLSEFSVELHKGDAPELPEQLRSGISGQVIFSQDGHILAAVQNSKRTTEDYRFTILLWEVWEDTRRQQPIILKGHTNIINALAFTANSRTLASGSDDGTIRVWDTNAGTQISSLPSSKVRSLAFSVDGKILASGSTDQIQLWDITSGKQLISLEGQNESVTDLEFSPDNKILTSGSRDGMIQLWDISTGKLLASLRGHTCWVTNLAFSSDGKILASGDSDGAIFIWNVPN